MIPSNVSVKIPLQKDSRLENAAVVSVKEGIRGKGKCINIFI